MPALALRSKAAFAFQLETTLQVQLKILKAASLSNSCLVLGDFNIL